MNSLHTKVVVAGSVHSARSIPLHGNKDNSPYKLPSIASLNAELTEEYWTDSPDDVTYRSVSMRLFETSDDFSHFMDEWSLTYNPALLFVAAVHLNGVNPQNPPNGFPWFSSCLDRFKIRGDKLILTTTHCHTIVVLASNPVRVHFFEGGLYFCWSSAEEECICHYVPISCCLVRFDNGKLEFHPYKPTFNSVIRSSLRRHGSLLDYYNDFLTFHFDVESANRSWLRRRHLPKRFFKVDRDGYLHKNIKTFKNMKNLINPYKNICFKRIATTHGNFKVPEMDFSFCFLYEDISLFLNLFKWAPTIYSHISHTGDCDCDRCPRNYCSFNLLYSDLDYTSLEEDLEAQVRLSDFLPGMPTVPLQFELGEETSDQITSLIAVLRELAEGFSAKTTEAFSTVENLLDYGKRMTIGLASAYVVYCALKAYTEGDFAHLTKVFSALPLVLASFPLEIANYISGFINYLKPTEIEAQGETQGPIPWEHIATLSLGVVHLFTTGAFGKRFDPVSLMKLVSMLPKASEGFMTVLDGFITVVKYCTEYVRVDLLGFDPSTDDKILYPRVIEWLNSVKEVISLEKDGKLSVTSENFDRITRLQITGMTIFKYDKFGKDSSAILNKVRYFMNLLDHAKKPFEQSCIKTDLCRVEPLTILIRGSPGTGKSFMIKPFVHQLLAKILPAERLHELYTQPDSFVYNRQTEHEYWDGYRGQFVTIMDDFGQVVDVPGNADNEFMSLIRGTNKFPYVLHMASLEDKGSNIFTSKVIVCTTNMMTFQNVESIHDKEALIRRFDYIIDLEVKEEFSYVRPGDPGRKVKKGMDISMDIWNFNIMEGVNVTNTGTVNQQLDFDQFVNLCARIYKSKEAKLSEYNKVCRNDLVTAINERAREEATHFDWMDEFDAMQPKKVEYVDVIEDFVPEELHSFGFTVQTWAQVERFFLFAKNDWTEYADPSTCYSKIRDYLTNLGPKFQTFVDKICSMNFYDFLLDKTSEFINYIYKLVESTKKMITDVLVRYPLLSALTTACTCASAFYAISTIFSIEGMSGYKNRKANRRMAMKVKDHVPKSYRISDNISFDMQGPGIDQNADQLADKMCRKNTLLFCLPGCTTIKSGTVLMLCGGVGLMPNHYFEIIQARLESKEIEVNDLVEFRYPNGAKFQISNIEEMLKQERYVIPNKDLVVFLLPGKTRVFPNIVKSFVTEDQIKDFIYPSCVMYIVNEEGEFVANECEATMITGPIKYTLGKKSLDCSQVFRVGVQTERGDCGSFVVLQDPKSGPGKILGVHVAGNKYLPYGYSVTTIRSEIEAAIAKIKDFTAIQGPVFDEELLKPEFDGWKLNDEFLILGRSNVYCSQATKTEMVKVAALHGVLAPATRAPARLTDFDLDGERVRPLKNSILKYSGAKQCIPDILIRYCTNNYYSFIMQNSKKPEYKELLTFEESVAGIPGNDFISGIPRGTSPGFPMTAQRPFGSKGKKHWFGEEGDYEFDSPQCIALRERCEFIISEAKEGRRCLHIYADHLKDECRPLERVRIGKTRLISGAPLPFVVVFRQYFMHFSAWLMENRIQNGVAVGTNPYSEDWDNLKHVLGEVGDNLIAGDYSGWDSTQFAEIGDHILRMINMWYNDCEENQKVRQILWLELYNSVHVFGDIVYMWHKGMPSGNPFTTICNSIYNNIVIRMAWVDCHDCELSSLKRFDTFVRACTYGDDNLISVHDAVKEVFNITNLTACMASYGLTYTDEHKDVNNSVTVFRSINDVTFLKRSFVHDKVRNRTLAPLEFEVIEQMLNYVRGRSDFKTTVQQCYGSWKRELSLYPIDVYNEKMALIRPIMEDKFNFFDPINDHAAVRDLVLNEVMFY